MNDQQSTQPLEIDPALIARTKGFLDPEEGQRLYAVALEASRLGPCLEIGSYCGKSTLYIGAACKNQQHPLCRGSPCRFRGAAARRRVF
ncbi:MAG: hypothetical protein R2875_06365 [Desulfobacterales bacterium]